MIARRISLITGLYLFAFLFAHLINLSLGLDSVETMDSARRWLLAPWTNPVGGGLLFVSLCFHVALGLRSLYRRNTLRLNPFDAFQLLLGLCIPFLLFPHMIAMSMLPALTDHHASYRQVLGLFWIDEPLLGLRQIVGLMVVWLHSCMGLFVWMRLQNWWSSVSLFVYPTIVLLPTLALLGFVEAGKDVIASAGPVTSIYQTTQQQSGGYSYTDSDSDSDSESDSGQSYEYGSSDVTTDNNGEDSTVAPPAGAQNKAMQTIASAIRLSLYGYLSLLALVLLARRWRLRGNGDLTSISYGGSDTYEAQSGTTLLEVSRVNNVAHASFCGGKGRCGTCQVAVHAGAENLSPKTEIEKRKLQQIEAAENVRLACQAQVLSGHVSLDLLLPGYVVAADMPHRRRTKSGAVATASTQTDNVSMGNK